MPCCLNSRAKDALKPEPAPTINADENCVLSIAVSLSGCTVKWRAFQRLPEELQIAGSRGFAALQKRLAMLHKPSGQAELKVFLHFFASEPAKRSIHVVRRLIFGIGAALAVSAAMVPSLAQETSLPAKSDTGADAKAANALVS
jgi:hypothetical protein